MSVFPFRAFPSEENWEKGELPPSAGATVMNIFASLGMEDSLMALETDQTEEAEESAGVLYMNVLVSEWKEARVGL